MLHLTAKESFMPSSDVFILDDNDVMILLYLGDYLHRLVFPSGIQTLMFSSDFPYSSIPAIGVPCLTGKFSLQSLQTLAFSDPYIICIPIGIGYACLYTKIKSDRCSVIIMPCTLFHIVAGQQDVVSAWPAYKTCICHLPRRIDLLNAKDLERLFETGNPYKPLPVIFHFMGVPILIELNRVIFTLKFQLACLSAFCLGFLQSFHAMDEILIDALDELCRKPELALNFVAVFIKGEYISCSGVKAHQFFLLKRE